MKLGATGMVVLVPPRHQPPQPLPRAARLPARQANPLEATGILHHQPEAQAALAKDREPRWLLSAHLGLAGGRTKLAERRWA